MAEGIDYSLLGTVVRVEVAARRFMSPNRVVASVFARIRQLEKVFNLFDEASAISALRAHGQTDNEDLRHVLALGQEWKQRTDGLYEPRSGAALDLNGIAKGWIVDRAADEAHRARRIVIDAGGDIVHWGQGSLRVGIEDPAQPYDNVRPDRFITLDNAAIATSGPSRRGDHLWKPSGEAASHPVRSASVVAADAATADVLATAFAVTDPDHALRIADRENVAALVVTSEGEAFENERWTMLEI